MSKSVKGVLIEARKLIEKRENWGRGDFRTGNDEKGYRYCAVGALMWCKPQGKYTEALSLLEREMGSGIVAFNDISTHAEVLAAFDRAIESAS